MQEANGCGRGRLCKVEGRGINRTSSHMWDKWNLHMFLLWDGSLTLMYMTSLMVLVMCTTLHTMEKLSTLVWWPVVLAWWQMGERALRCSLSLCPKVLAGSPVYSSSQSILSHLYLWITLLLLHLAHTSSFHTGGRGSHSLCLHYTTMVGMWSCTKIRCQTIWHLISLSAYPMMPSVVSITFSHKPDKAMLFAMMNTCLILENVLFFISYKEYL